MPYDSISEAEKKNPGLAKYSEKAKKVPLPSGAGICGHVVGTGKSLVVNDAQDDPRFVKKQPRLNLLT